MGRKAKENDGFSVKGIAAFTTTGTTVSISAMGLKVITAFSLTEIGAYSANDKLSLNATVNLNSVTGDRTITVPASGTLTVERNAAGGSGRAFSYVLYGY